MLRHHKGVILCLALLAVCLGMNFKARAATVPYANDFEGPIGPEWTNPTLVTTEPLRFTRCLGRGGAQTLTLEGLTPGESYSIWFDLYILDTWDGGNTNSGDVFLVQVDGTPVFRHSFANYNGNPPSGSQSFRQPDEGRENLGFNTANNWFDAIYRSIEVTFIPTGSVATVVFNGANLEVVANESWAIDNIEVKLSTATTGTVLRSTTLPSAGSTNFTAISFFAVAASAPLSEATATNSAFWSLREAGANGVFGDGDDLVYNLSVTLAGFYRTGRSMLFNVVNGPLQPGRYRFQNLAGLTDTNGVAVPPWSRDFVIALPPVSALENTVNDTLPGATALPLTESPPGSGFWTAVGAGNFSAVGEVDYWRFDAEAGDRLTVRLEALNEGVYPRLYLQNVSGGNLATVNGNYEGVATIQQYLFTSPGTYYLRVWSDNGVSQYFLRADVGRGCQLESEANNSLAAANSVNFAALSGVMQGRLAGSLTSGDTAGDYFVLTTLNPGNSVAVLARFPDGSTLSAATLGLEFLAAGSTNPLAVNIGNTLNFTVATSAVYYVRAVTAAGKLGLRSQYVLDFTIGDGVQPEVVGSSLPAEGAATGMVLDRFTLDFSESLSMSTMTNAAHYELRGAGADALFGTADDDIYTVNLAAYSGGLSASYWVPDGPVQPGLVRLAVATNVTDRAGNPLVAFTRTFTITNEPGYVLEKRDNQQPGRAGYLVATPSAQADGTFSFSSTHGVGNSPHFPAVIEVNGDAWPDLAVPNYGAHSLTILTNNGRGGFALQTTISGLSGPVAAVAGHFNSDTNQDLAVANNQNGTVSILINSNGLLTLLTNLSGFSQPYQLAAGDFNGDGATDLAVPNYNAGNVRIVLGNGDGTFRSGTNYSTPANPLHVAVGLLNGDHFPDLAVANYSGSVRVFLGDGTGGFQSVTNYFSGSGTRSVAIGDVTGDGTNDLVLVSAGEDSLSVFAGNGDGTFQPRRTFNNGAPNTYQVALGDFNGDGALDAVMSSYAYYGPVSLLLNNGAGLFTNGTSISIADYPLGVAVADFNGDGRSDLAVSRYGAATINVYFGNAASTLVEDPPGSGLRSGMARGNITDNNDVDYYRFTATAGELAMVAIETPGAPAESGLRVDLLQADGQNLTWFYPNATGWGQSALVTLPYTGTYIVAVNRWYDYRGEYRVRVSTAHPPLQFESENNDTPANANLPAWTSTNGHLVATVAGYLSRGDGAGDHFNLGVLKGGTTVAIHLAQPASSGFAGILTVLNAAGQRLTNSPAGATNFLVIIPPGADGTYVVRLTSDPVAPAQTIGGQPGHALYFSGASEYVTIPDAPSLRPVNLTLEGWVNFAALASVQHLFAKPYGTGIDNSYVIWYQNGALRAYVRGSSDLAYTWTPEIGRWYHVAYTFDDAANQHVLYLDGQVVASGTVTSSILYDSQPLLFGADFANGSPTDFLQGKLDEVRLWNVVRAPSEIQAFAAQRLTGSEAGLAGYWRLDEGAGLLAADATTNNNHGTLINAPVWTSSALNPARPMALAAQYVLSLDITDASPLLLTGNSLPPPGAVVSNILQDFTLSFNKDLDPRINLINRRLLRYGDSAYLLTDSSSSWLAAQAFAAALGGHLATVNDAAENAWLRATFSAAGDLWIGLNDWEQEGRFQWVSGQPLTYTNWMANKPDNAGAAYGVYLDDATGRWADSASVSLRGIVEVPAMPDTDADGLPNAADPFPEDPRNGVELRSAGPDGLFDTADDQVYDLDTNGYTQGTNLYLVMVDGPLQAGTYRLSVTTALRDRLGNPLSATHTQLFTIAPVGGFTLENRTNGSMALATSLSPLPGSGNIGAFAAGTNLASGNSPYFILATNLNADTNLDLVVANHGSASVGIYVGQPDGSFLHFTNHATPNGPIGMAVADFNKDGQPDLAVACYYADLLHIRLGNGAAGFVALTNYPTPSRPHYLTAGDFNEDGNPDVAVANYSGGSISIFLGNGDGTFQPRTDRVTGSGALQIAAADLNNDGHLDLLVVNRTAPSLSVLLGAGNGTFQLVTNQPLSTTAYGMNVADLDANGTLDVVVICNNMLNYLPGNGNGTFGARRDFNINTSQVYDFTLMDTDGNGTLDLVMPDYGNSRLVIVANLGGGNFGSDLNYPMAGQVISVAPGDFNHDGRMDLALADYSGNQIILRFGVGGHPLALDSSSGLRYGAGRGTLNSSSDEDYWSFSALANDRLVLAVDTPLPGYGRQNRYIIYRPDGTVLADFYPNDNGYGTYNAVLSASGIYTIRVLNTGYQYRGEYRFRVTLAPPSMQYETEDNNTLANANALNFTLVGGRRSAAAFGYLGVFDPGDYFRLGNLSEATAIALRPRLPSTSGLVPWLSIYKANGEMVAQGVAGSTNVTHVINAGEGGSYMFQVRAAFTGRGNGATNGLVFDGVNDYVNLGSWSPGAKWTVQAWVQPLTLQAGRRTVVGGIGGCQDWGISLVDGRFSLSTKPPGACSVGYTATEKAVPGQWYHLAATCDGTNAQLYVNGMLAASGPVERNYAPYSGAIWIGAEACCGNYFSGLIQDVAAWSRALEPAEVAALVSINLTGSETGLVGWWRLQNGSGSTVTDLGPLNRTGTLVNGPQWTPLVEGPAAAPGLLTEYTIEVELLDTQPPYITGTTLPAEGAGSGALWDRFSLTFSEDMNPATVANSSNYELRQAGPDAAFDTADDELYTVVNSPAYANGTNASFIIPDGPLQPGQYRFTVRSNVTDTSGSYLAAEFIRNFTVTNLPGYVVENRNNGSPALATSLSWARTNQPSASLRAGPAYNLPGLAGYVAMGDLNGDTNLDLVIPVYGNHTISVYTGTGDGSFALRTNFAVANGPLVPVLLDLNGDAWPDLLASHNGANSLGVYLGQGDGSFVWRTNYNTGVNPYGITVADFNGDGRPDAVVANNGSSTISVFFGNGDGTFQPAVNYATGASPIHVASGDVNGDGRPDVVVANNGTDNVSLFLNNGDGTFAPAVTLAVNNRPRAIVLADMDGDGHLDILTGNDDNTISWLKGNGHGTFSMRANIPSDLSVSFGLAAADLNSDNRLDLVVSGYNNNRIGILLNAGNGQFEPPMLYGTASSPTGVKVADFNNDGRPDVVAVCYHGNSFQIFLGRDTEPLPAAGGDGRVFTSLARGKIYNTSDDDYYSFSANAGDGVQVAIETVGNPAASGLYLYLFRPDGSQLTAAPSDYYGSGTLTATLPVSGTYSVMVRRYYDFFQEYRLRVSVVKPPLGVEAEYNDGIGSANNLGFISTPGRRVRQVFGSLNATDSADFYRLGSLAPGTAVTLTWQRPDLSALSAALAIFRDNTQVASAPADTTNLVYIVPAGAGGNYYARISAANSTAGLLAHYVLTMELTDASRPEVVATTLPSEGTVHAGLIDRFTVTFNKDLNLAAIQNGQNVRLRGGHAYFLTSDTMSWIAAATEAMARGGHLATINDAEENDWILATFGTGFWIGLTDEAQEGNWVWMSGEPVTYTNWNSGEPNNSGNEDYAQFIAGGRWNDAPVTSTMRGLIEVAGPDADGDGYPDAVDPFPADPYNLFDLRGPGPDGQFDTADDEVYRLNPGNYSGGVSLALTLADGPLQPGLVRFRVTTSLRDVFGNTSLANRDQFFTITNLPGFTMESRTNSAAWPDFLVLQSGPGNVRQGLARGKREFNNDVDYWRFSGNAGDVLSLAVDAPGNPGASSLRYQVFDPGGTRILVYDPDYYGYGVAPAVTLPTNGNYLVTVSASYDYQGEYQFRVSLAPPPVVVENEPNDTLATANLLPLQEVGNARVGQALGSAASASDLDYFNLGTLTNGTTVFLLARLPDGSTYVPAVSLYNAAGQYQGEVGGANAGDSVAEVRILTTGTYYALVRGTTPATGVRAHYLLEVQAVPTGTVSFPNLVVTTVSLPAGTPLSGEQVHFSFTVANAGSLGTAAASWLDRAAFSLNTTLGDADDIPLGFFLHLGSLEPGQVYTFNESFRLPDGISGDYYLIVQVDSGNAVNEFIFEADNVFVSSSTFRVERAAYPDLKIEEVVLTGPDGNGTYTIQWLTANRGGAAVTNGFYERFLLRNLTSGQVLTNVETFTAGGLAVNATLARAATVTTTNPGNYQIEITTDSRGDIYEFDALSHASAEANTVRTNFTIAQMFAISVAANPPGAGVVSGGGSYPAGSVVNVGAQALTNELPYFFVNWTENGVFQSGLTNYSFTATRHRVLVANFSLPTYLLTASNHPPGAGVVAGQGAYFHGTTNVLRALPNPGYAFTNWTEGGVVIADTLTLTNIALSNRFVVANYYEANPFHVVTTATSPTNVATVSGAGTYTNGQSVVISAPGVVTNPPNIYYFREFRLAGTLVSSSPSFAKTFSTLDPTNLHYVAHYDTVSILPLVTNVLVSHTNPVPATTNFLLGLQFNRSMDTNFAPEVVLSNRQTTAVLALPGGGAWSSMRTHNDTYTPAAITFALAQDGTYDVLVSQARDLFGSTMSPTNAAVLVVDATPPPLPSLTLNASNSSSVTVAWTTYSAPPDVAAYRAFIRPTNYTTVGGLPIVASLSPAARSYTFGGLALDTVYHVCIVPVDVAGNTVTSVTTLPVFLPSTVPPPVPVTVAPAGADAAQISWFGYSTANLFGFAGFRLYYETNQFSSIAGMTVRQTLGAGERSITVAGLDRRQTYYFAVVGFNGTNGYQSSVATGIWRDPFAGDIVVNLTLGGAGQTVDVLQPINVLNHATLTIPAGTTVRFASGAGITVTQGRLVADGTALDPVILTSFNDVPGGAPMPGDWEGIILGPGAGNSVLRHVFVRFGRGLVVDGCSPTVAALTAVYNQPAGLRLRNGASLATADGLLAFNQIGVLQSDTSSLNLRFSVVKNNTTNAWNTGATSLVATQVWWGSAVPAEIAATISGNVQTDGFLPGEPLLTPALGTSNNVTQVGTTNVWLRLACRTADAMRISEDSRFIGTFYEDFAPYRLFNLSEGGGVKTIFAQFRSVTGETSDPVSVSITYLTQGPVISAFSLSEGQVLNRPTHVTGAAHAPLGMASMEFYVNNVGQATNAGGAFSHGWDVRGFSNGIYRVKLLARDTAGRVATLERNVAIVPTPPPAPAISTPAADVVVTSNQLSLTGTAEPGVAVRLLRNGAVAGLTTADAQGQWSMPNVGLVEGNNVLVASAFDDLGSAASSPRQVVLDSGPPAAPVLQAPVYYPGRGVEWSWQYAPSGERPTRFRLFWHVAPFNTTTEATGQSGLIVGTLAHLLGGLPAGSYYFAVVGYDDAGNASPLSNLVFYHHDPVPPSFTIAFNKPSPVSTGPLRITLTANEPLAERPTVTLNYGTGPITLTVSNTAVNTYEGTLLVGPFTPSRPVTFTVSATDLAGNVFNGPPAGPALEIDVAPPIGTITTVPASPVQVTNATAIQVNLTLNEAAKPGTTPVLEFTPPAGGAPIPIALSGNERHWSGMLNLTPAAGSGFGQFTLAVMDALENAGNAISSGASLEIYNSAQPTPPPAPTQLAAHSLSGGYILIQWAAVSNAEIYRVYADPGSNGIPQTIVADELTATVLTNLPPADGPYRIAVSALRRGAESAKSTPVTARSDRTPPPAPTNVTVQLVATGLRVSWRPGPGETPANYRVYRNGSLIATVSSGTNILDVPPRGVLAYTVGARDALGNEALGGPAMYEMLVGAVKNLEVVHNLGQAPILTWESDDATAVGFNVYRNGVKQNAVPLTSPTYTDGVGVPRGGSVTYAVRAVNATNAESAARTAELHDVSFLVMANLFGGVEGPLVTRYFDAFQVTVFNRANATPLPLHRVELRRVIAGQPQLTRSNILNALVPPRANLNSEIVMPSSPVTTPQMMVLRAVRQPDETGSTVIYQNLVDYVTVVEPTVMVEVSATQPPLAGGLAAVNIRVHNQGYADMDLITARASGMQPGDVTVLVRNHLGQEVNRVPFAGLPSGTLLTPEGVALLRIPAGASRSFVVDNILVPEALGTNTVTFVAEISNIYYRYNTATQALNGPLRGQMVSSLRVSPYYGQLTTDKSTYSDRDPVLITGQALNRQTGLPQPNVPLKIGFFTRGFKFYHSVTSDFSGAFTYEYHPPPGVSGRFKIWAAHPDVFDVLNQAEVAIYRAYFSPVAGDVRMTKNDTLTFNIMLINPGEEDLSGFTLDYEAWTMVGTNRVALTNLTATAGLPPDFVIGPRENVRIPLSISAAADAPDNAQMQLRLRSEQGATAVFDANLSLLPANPVVTVIDPVMGYVDVSVNRGQLLSRTFTIANRGLRDLQGVTLQPPTNVAWMLLNLPVEPDGLIHLPDLRMGASNTLTVVFAPPADAPLEHVQDTLYIRGTNFPSAFPINLFALVTSSSRGNVRFVVDNILVQRVPDATVRIKNNLLQQEYVVKTDANGEVLLENLQEGPWSWQVTAPGHAAEAGRVEVVANQTVLVEPRLARSLVTVNFIVVPVPFTDRYEITIEQTFQTHVPVPVLVMTPPQYEFFNIEAGYEATVIYNVKNHGLVRAFDLQIFGGADGYATSTPLIHYVPELGAMQSIDIPFRFNYRGREGTNAGSLSPQFTRSRCLTSRAKCLGRDVDEDGNITGGVEFPPGYGQPTPGDCTGGIFDLDNFAGALMAIVNACAQCPDLKTLMSLATKGIKKYTEKAKFYKAIEGVVMVYKLLGCPTPPGGGGNFGGSGGGGGGGGGTVRHYSDYGTGGGCFAAGTEVLLADGRSIPIEQVRVGDRVRTGPDPREQATVMEVAGREAARLVELELSDGRRLQATPEHHIWVDQKGWVFANQVAAGDWLYDCANRRVRVAAVVGREGATRVYTLVNREDHAFYANGVLVRDSCGDKTPLFLPIAPPANAFTAPSPPPNREGKGVAP